MIKGFVRTRRSNLPANSVSVYESIEVNKQIFMSCCLTKLEGGSEGGSKKFEKQAFVHFNLYRSRYIKFNAIIHTRTLKYKDMREDTGDGCRW